MRLLSKSGPLRILLSSTAMSIDLLPQPNRTKAQLCRSPAKPLTALRNYQIGTCDHRVYPLT